MNINIDPFFEKSYFYLLDIYFNSEKYFLEKRLFLYSAMKKELLGRKITLSKDRLEF